MGWYGNKLLFNYAILQLLVPPLTTLHNNNTNRGMLNCGHCTIKWTWIKICVMLIVQENVTICISRVSKSSSYTGLVKMHMLNDCCGQFKYLGRYGGCTLYSTQYWLCTLRKLLMHLQICLWSLSARILVDL